MKLIFAHGWGFDSEFWDIVIDALSLPQGAQTLKLDFGYTGNPADIDLHDHKDAIYIGHSLGCLWLLKHMIKPKAFIAINGFDCFFRYTPALHIKKMQRNLDRNINSQMRGFYDACGVKSHSLRAERHWNYDALKMGLDWLETWDQNTERQALTCPVKSLCAKDDTIISSETSADIWTSESLITSDTGGHVLPLTRPDWCAKHIKDVVNAL